MKQIVVKNITLPLGVGGEEAVAQALRRLRPLLGGGNRLQASIYKKSIDARKRESIQLVWSVLVQTEQLPRSLDAQRMAKVGAVLLEEGELLPSKGNEQLSERPIVVGFGPAGMFAALLLAEQGYRPIVIERGADVEERARQVARFNETGILDPEANVQFGAGGAGTFSDGKLVTRVNDHRLRYVLETFAALGAPEEILTSAKPHIGTDRLRIVVGAMRDKIRALGGEVLFHTGLCGIKRKADGHIRAIVTNRGEMPCGALILAIGHSARDTYAMLRNEGIVTERKPFSVGLRIEHLQDDIDEALFGRYAGHPELGKGEYALSRRVGEEAVYTFCMCPGGEVMAAASEQGGVVTNGMSFYARDGKNANAAIAVSVFPEDGIAYQRALEQAAFCAGGGDFRAPIQTVGDFLAGDLIHEPTRIQPSYRGGGENTRLFDLSRLFEPRVNEMLRLGIRDFDRKLRGFSVPDAILTGVETRTSAPLRILRGKESYTAPGCENLYPCGEGAGYAGGISSAAIDGIACAGALIARFACPSGE